MGIEVATLPVWSATDPYGRQATIPNSGEHIALCPLASPSPRLGKLRLERDLAVIIFNVGRSGSAQRHDSAKTFAPAKTRRNHNAEAGLDHFRHFKPGLVVAH